MRSTKSFVVKETSGIIDVERSPLVYLDTNVFIRAFESNPEEAQDLKLAFDFLRMNRNLAVTSELTLAELLAPSRQLARPNKKDFYLNLLLGYRFVDLCPVTTRILIATAELRKSFPAKLPDAIHVVTAIETRCAFFLSSDHGTRRLPDGLIHLLPEEAGIRTLMEALRA